MLTKSQVIMELAGHAGVEKRQVAVVLESLVALAKEECRTSGTFDIPYFGKILKVHRDARVGRDQHGQPVQITAKELGKFRLDPRFKEAVVSRQSTLIDATPTSQVDATVAPQVNEPVDPQNDKRLLQNCPKCGVPVREDRLTRHLSRVHHVEEFQAPPDQTNGVSIHDQVRGSLADGQQPYQQEKDVPVVRLPFELLPPGTWDIEHVISYYHGESGRIQTQFGGRKLDLERLSKLKSLGPTRYYVGTELWVGYVVFEFLPAKRVILDCPFEGNAIYVLSGNWKEMVMHTKLYLRERFPRECIRIFHSGNWLARVKAAL